MDKTNTERYFVRKRMRLEDVSYADPRMVYFATLCARDGKEVFSDTELAKQVVTALRWITDKGLLRIYAYCLMPNHLHFASSLCSVTQSMSEVIGRFKSYTTQLSWNVGFKGELWQRSWYDHIARRDEDVLAICEYILANPVRKNLVDSVDEWPYSGMPDVLPW